jgi:shikimate kinase
VSEAKSSISSALWICLTGFMGSGKTTVGTCLAEILGWRFVDLDREIVDREGKPIAEIFQNQGETYFRTIEAEVLDQVFSQRPAPCVIALGGGTYIQPANRDLLCRYGARTIYLEADFALLLDRCGAEQGTRPLMQDIEQFRRLHDERGPIYRSAELIVEIANRTPQEIALEIANEVKKWNVQTAVSE